MRATVADGVETMQAVRLSIPAKPEYITLGRLALAGLARLRPEPARAGGRLPVRGTRTAG